MHLMREFYANKNVVITQILHHEVPVGSHQKFIVLTLSVLLSLPNTVLMENIVIVCGTLCFYLKICSCLRVKSCLC